MFLERIRRIVLFLMGLLFVAGIYPLISISWNHEVPGYTDAMMMSLYATLGIFLLLSTRNPSANRYLIACAGWANLAHAATMTFMVLFPPQMREHLPGVIGFSVIGFILLLLVPPKSALIDHVAS